MVVVIEDDWAIADLFAKVIEKSGGRAIVESSPVDALAIYVNDMRITAVVADYQLGGALDGIEVLASFQELRPDVRRLLVTAHPKDEAIVDALRAGIIEVLLEKPPRIADLRVALGLSASHSGASR